MNHPLRAVVLGLMLGASTQGLLSCSTQPPVPTAFFITVFFNPQLGTEQLVFSGNGPNSVQYFPTTALPTMPQSTLTSPQSARVLLPDALAGTEVNLVVIGVDADGRTVESASALQRVEKGVDVAVAMTLVPFANRLDGGLSDAGGADAGGVDGGRTDAGADGGTDGRDGGTMCRCATGCCLPGSTTCATAIVLDTGQGPGRKAVGTFGCGPIGGQCAVQCNTANSSYNGMACTTASCQCGNGPACGPGLFCDVDKCVCNAQSCPGPSLPSASALETACCGAVDNKPACLPVLGRNQCGNTGAQCEMCNTVCSNAGVCGACAASNDKCCSANGTQNVEFPRCRTALGVCFTCDWLRSNSCGELNNVGTCRCGANPVCGINQKCVRASAAAPFQCVPL